jgi:carboxyl-terminal processing protease
MMTPAKTVFCLLIPTSLQLVSWKQFMPLRNVILVAASIIFSLACYSVALKNQYASLFAEAMELVSTQSLKVIPKSKLFDSAMNGMLSDLDEHSMFISGDMFKAFDEDMRGEFGGLGMFIENNPFNERIFVLAPLPGTPAYEAGLRVGDEIVEIDGVSTEGMKRSDAISLLRGPISKKVELTIDRAEVRSTKSIRRASITMPSVHGDYRNLDATWQFRLTENPRIGYVRLLSFGDRSAEDLAAVLKKLNGNVDGFVLDLRNNSGGLLNIAIEICDMFIEQDKTIVSTKGRNNVTLQVTKSRLPAIFNASIPLVILINRNSASASEIVAGCLQDHQRAYVIGEQSWGKGTVQNVIPMQRNQSALKLTTSSYWRPSEKHIDRYDDIAIETNSWGVQPDLTVELTNDDIFNNARQRNLRDLEGLVPKEHREKLDELQHLRFHFKDSSDASAETPSPDETTDVDDEPFQIQRSDEPQIDRPLEKAIEYFESLLKRQRVAA